MTSFSDHLIVYRTIILSLWIMSENFVRRFFFFSLWKTISFGMSVTFSSYWKYFINISKFSNIAKIIIFPLNSIETLFKFQSKQKRFFSIWNSRHFFFFSRKNTGYVYSEICFREKGCLSKQTLIFQNYV